MKLKCCLSPLICLLTTNKNNAMPHGTTTLPVDSNTESQQARAGGNLPKKVKNELENGTELADSSESKRSSKEYLVASAAQGTVNLPLPNAEGTVGTVPLEVVNPKEFKKAPSRDVNKFDTSIDKPAAVSRSRAANQLADVVRDENEKNLYPWKSIGGFNASGKASVLNSNSKIVKAYITENFYNDWYYNIAGIVGTCFFSWVIAYLGLSWWSLGFVFFCTASVYRAEFRRFNRNIRDDLQRITVEETLSERTETTLWLNSFLSKFWVIYMPVLSQQVKDVVNPNLAGVAPGYGIEALSLDEFTLGTKSPTIDGIKSYTKKGKDTVEMDWQFSFTPNDVSNMTAIEAKEKINPKIALGVTIGKSFVSKSLPVLVEDINVAGRMRITIKFGESFPNIKTVSISLLEPPLIDFALKPVGGDTLGLDVMSFLPGLKTFVKTMINSNVGPMLYSPNKLDIDVEEIMAAQSQDTIGVVAVTVRSAEKLKGSDFITNTVDPYVTITTDNEVTSENDIRTSIKSDVTSPRWNETKYLLVNSLNQKLHLKCFDFNDIRKDSLIGELEFDMSDLYQQPAHEDLSSELKGAGKTRGTLNYDIHWFPVIEDKSGQSEGVSPTSSKDNEVKDEQEEAAEEDTDVGILKFTLHKVKYLDTSSSLTGSLSPSAELFIDGKRVKRYRTLRRLNEPSWEEATEVLVPSKSNSELTLKVYDVRVNGKELLCEYSSSLEDVINSLELGQASVKGSPRGEIFVSATWKPVAMTGSFAAASVTREPLGTVRLHLLDATIKGDLSGVGDVDPYVKVSLNKHVKYRSNYFSETSHPSFNSLVYLPVTSENQTISVDLFDYQKFGNDRLIGSYQLPVSSLMSKDEKTGRYKFRNGSKDIQRCQLMDKKKRHTANHINVSFSFIPTIPVYSPRELETVKELEKKIADKKTKFTQEQEELKKQMEKNPKEYEIVEIEDNDEDELKLQKKEKMDLKQLCSFNSGVLNFQVLKGKLSKSSAYLQVLFDDFSYPASISFKSRDGVLAPESSDFFVRDLKNSTIIFRITKKPVVKNTSEIISESSFNVLKLLEKGYQEPVDIDVKGSKLSLRLLYTPSAVKLPSSESILDTGVLNLDVISADNIPSHDRNGKSDPFVVVKVDGEKVYKSETIKKTLSPVWNEKTRVPIPSRSRCKVAVVIYDWDRAGSNDLLAETVLSTTEFTPDHTHDLNLNLNPQGTIKLKAKFVPQYLRPAVDLAEGGLASMPLKAVGSFANMGANVAGSGLGAATNVAGAGLGAASNVTGAGLGGLQKGGRFLKGLGGSRKQKNPDLTADSANDNTSQKRPLSTTVRSSLDFDPSVPNTSYASVQPPAQPPAHLTSPSPPNSGENSSIAGSAGPIHKRNASSASSFARTLAPNGTYKGTVTIVGAENLGKAVQVRVSLAQGGRIKHLYRTENQKSNEKGVAEFNESCTFKASPEANLVFGAVSHHKFSKDTDLGVAQINLGDPQIQQEGQVAIKLGKGHLVLKIEYGDAEVPPVPSIPSEYKQ